MKVLRIAGPVAMLSGLFIAFPAASQQKVSEINIERTVDLAVRDVSPVFLSETNVALLVRSEKVDTAPRMKVLLRLSEGTLQIVARAIAFAPSSEIRSLSGQRVLLSGARSLEVCEADLQHCRQAPRPGGVFSQVFPLSSRFGVTDRGHWALYQIGPEIKLLNEGAGQMLATSDEAILLRNRDSLRLCDVNGQLLTSIPVPVANRAWNIGEIAGPGRIYVDLGGSPQIFGTSGAQFSLRRRRGWGYRHGWAADGRRILFNHYITKLGVAERVLNALASVVSPVPEEATGEVITVVDTQTDRVCFEFSSPSSLLGDVGRMHADISPSGRLVGIATRQSFAIYALPQVCSGI